MTQTAHRPSAAAPRTRAASAVRTALDATARLSPDLAGRLALELWRRPGKPAAVRPDERAVHEAARTSYVDNQHGRVAAYAWGDGERPVLLVHGWGARASRLAEVVTALLDRGHSPVSYDAWGHGATPGRARTILDHQVVIAELERRHGPFTGVVAHSFGVLVSAYAVRQGLAAERVVGISGMGDFGYLVDTFCAGLGVGQPVNGGLRRAIERAFFDGDSGVWERLSAQPLPGNEVLLVHDAGDRIVDRGQADLLLDTLGPDTRLLETTGLGHGRILRDPGVVAAAADFVTGAET